MPIQNLKKIYIISRWNLPPGSKSSHRGEFIHILDFTCAIIFSVSTFSSVVFSDSITSFDSDDNAITKFCFSSTSCARTTSGDKVVVGGPILGEGPGGLGPGSDGELKASDRWLVVATISNRITGVTLKTSRCIWIYIFTILILPLSIFLFWLSLYDTDILIIITTW